MFGFRLIAMHLLKAIHEQQMSTKSWLTTINWEKIDFEYVLEDDHSLKVDLPVLFVQLYENELQKALAGTRYFSMLEGSKLIFDPVRNEVSAPKSMGRNRE